MEGILFYSIPVALSLLFSLADAYSVFKLARSRGNANVIVWTTMINGFGQHGEGEKALELYNKLTTNMHIVPPTEQTFTAILAACSHTKLVKEALDIYNSMQSKYGTVQL